MKRLGVFVTALALGTAIVAGCAGEPITVEPTSNPSSSPTATPTVPHLPGLEPGWSTFTAADGIVEYEHLHAIAVAPDGTLWLGTRWDGVYHFDGTTWETYINELPHYNVLSLAVGPAGGIWAGMEEGIARFDGQAWASYRRYGYCREAYCPEPERVSFIALAPDGALWFDGGLGFERFDGETWNDLLWFDDLGLQRLDEESSTDPRLFGEHAPWPLQALAITAEGDFWVGTPEGALHFDGSPELATSGQNVTQYTTTDGLVHNSVEAIAVAPDGTLWFGTYHGASRFDGSPELTTSGQNWTTIDQLAGKRIRDIAVAPDGALWFATDTGIHRYAPETTTTMEPSPSPIFTPIPTQTPTITPYPTRTPIPTQTPTPSPTPGEDTPAPLPTIFQQVIPVDKVLPGDFERLHASSDGALWLITDEGIARMQEGIWSTYLENSTAGLVGIDGDGRAWVVSKDTGQISAWDGTTWTVYGDDKGWLPVPQDDGWHREVKWGESDGAGGFWVATSRDVRFFDGEQWTIYTPEEMGMGEVGPEELLAAFTLKIAKRSGSIWVGECDWAPPGPTGGQGLRWFDSSTDLTTGGQRWHGGDAPTASGCVAAIAEDKAGHVWAGVGANLWRFDPVSGEDPEFGIQTQFKPPDEPPVGWQRYGSINQITLDPTGDPWVTMLLCGGACCDNLVLYHVHDGTWTQVGEVGLPIGAFIDVAGISWYIGSSGVQRVAGTALEMVVPLQVQSVVVDDVERVWFVAWDRNALWLWTIEGQGG